MSNRAVIYWLDSDPSIIRLGLASIGPVIVAGSPPLEDFTVQPCFWITSNKGWLDLARKDEWPSIWVVPLRRAAIPISSRVDAPLILAFRLSVECPKSIGPLTTVVSPSASTLTPNSIKQSIMAWVSSHSGMPVRCVVPRAKAAIASCLRAIDLLPGRVISTSNDLLMAGIKNGVRGDKLHL